MANASVKPLTAADFEVATLGECMHPSPLADRDGIVFVDNGRRVRFHPYAGPRVPDAEREFSFEEAGPRRALYFDPRRTTAAIVTCGGLSPGLNNVIRSVYLELTHNYGVPRVLGIRNGYQGLNPSLAAAPVQLTPNFVEDIHLLGGTVLGTSRGEQPPAAIADFLEREHIDILFCVGGDGTQRGSHAIYEELARRGSPRAVIGIPKTIDNDIPFVSITFGYLTALEKAAEVLRGAHVEATNAVNGIAIVKLMGRDAGFIAAGAAVASDEANFVLIPEVAFPLEGPGGLLERLEQRMAQRGHALIVVAEGAGQHLFDQRETATDASGNLLHRDIGILLRERVAAHFSACRVPISLKYIDPSYVIRSVPANAWDRILASQMGRNAVHAAMAGRTNTLVAYWNGELTHVPIGTAVAARKRLDLRSDLWMAVLSTTGQPAWAAG